MNIQEQTQISFTIGSPIEKIDLKKLALEVKTNQAKLHQMTIDQTLFTATILQFNRKALTAIESKSYQQSLVYIEEAQKILEYVANCGKAIDRTLIIMTLHNTACIYQQMEEYKKCLSYLQGIFFNFQTIVSKKNKNLNKEEEDIILNSAIYHIQYCAMASQCNQHQDATKNAEIARQLLWNIILNSNYQFIDKSEIQLIYRIVKQPVDLLKILVGESIQKLKTKVNFSYSQQLSQLKRYAISQFLQLKQLGQQQKYTHSNIRKFSTADRQYIKVIYLAISYFCLANQNRIIANTNSGLVAILDQNLANQAERFHIICILILSKLFPVILTILESSLTLYQTHYKCNLIQYYHQNKQAKKQQLAKIMQTSQEESQLNGLNRLSRRGVSKIYHNSETNFQNKQILSNSEFSKHKTTIYTQKHEVNNRHKNNHITIKQPKVKTSSVSQKKKGNLKHYSTNNTGSTPLKKINTNSKSRPKSKKQHITKKSSPQSTKLKTPTYYKSQMIFSEMKNFQIQQRLKHHRDTLIQPKQQKKQHSKQKKTEKISPSKIILFNKHVKGKKSNLSPR